MTGLKAKYEETIAGLSAPPAIASKGRKEEMEEMEEEGRFWLNCEALRGRAEGDAEEKVMQRKRGEGDGSMTRVVFHLCVVDVLINTVRFSFRRPHGVLQRDSGEADWTERRMCLHSAPEQKQPASRKMIIIIIITMHVLCY